jgi:hypothetical protein
MSELPTIGFEVGTCWVLRSTKSNAGVEVGDVVGVDVIVGVRVTVGDVVLVGVCIGAAATGTWAGVGLVRDAKA